MGIEDIVMEEIREITKRLVKLMNYILKHDLDLIRRTHENFLQELLVGLYYDADTFVMGDCIRIFRIWFRKIFAIRFLQYAEKCKKLESIPEEEIEEYFAKKLFEVYHDVDIDEMLNRIEDEIEMMLRITEKGWY